MVLAYIRFWVLKLTYKAEGAKRPKPFFAFRQKSLFIAGRTSIGCQKKKKTVPGTCLLQHRDWSLRSTILNAHGTKSSPDGLCTRTHTKEAFSCWFCGNSFRIDGARRGNVCFSPTNQPVRKFKGGLGINKRWFRY